MNKKNKLKIFIFYFILTILIILNLFVWGGFIYIKSSKPMKYKPHSLKYNYLNESECYTNNIWEIKKDIDKLFKNPKYLFNFKQLPKGKIGETIILFRIINIDKDVNLFEFPFILAHELSHLINFTEDERFCNFNAFKILYESDNEYLKKVALNWLNYDICGLLSSGYSFAGWAEEYLNNINKN